MGSLCVRRTACWSLFQNGHAHRFFRNRKQQALQRECEHQDEDEGEYTCTSTFTTTY
jgi:hypothetical protein